MMFSDGVGGFCPWCGAMYGGTGMWLMIFFWLLVIAGVILLIVWLVRNSAAQGGKMPPSHEVQDDAALRIARERLARGEISKEEYETIVAALRG